MEEGERDLYVRAIAEAVAECHNVETLELVYKILIADDLQ